MLLIMESAYGVILRGSSTKAGSSSEENFSNYAVSVRHLELRLVVGCRGHQPAKENGIAIGKVIAILNTEMAGEVTVAAVTTFVEKIRIDETDGKTTATDDDVLDHGRVIAIGGDGARALRSSLQAEAAYILGS